MYRSRYFFYACLVSLSIYFDQAFAAYTYHTTGAGGIANDIMEPVGFFNNVVNAGCIILGTSFIFASVVKYFEHKRSPLMVTTSTIVFLLIGGLVLLAIPIFNYFFSRSYGISL